MSGRVGKCGLKCVCCCVEVFGDVCFSVFCALLRRFGVASELLDVGGACSAGEFAGMALALLFAELSQLRLCDFAACPAQPSPADCVLLALLVEPG